MSTTTPLTVENIGIVRSCFKEKFGIPRQPGLADAATAVVELTGAYADADTVRGLEQCSHLWILFLFSEHLDRKWTALVRPPRSGGKKMGVFATRSTFRPNPIGMSAVKLDRVEIRDGVPLLHIRGADILDGTPVIDIKPYLPYSDSIASASNTYAPDGQQLDLPVNFSPQAIEILDASTEGQQLKQLIEQVLRCDPRPTHQRGKAQERSYGTLLECFNVRWQITDDEIRVLSLEHTPQQPTVDKQQ
ncbi:MAG: tRNA (N6-threonylcarbamoyladenosine(37)-N6)-methyltransferase TrmO [Motiliproteus sp.]